MIAITILNTKNVALKMLINGGGGGDLNFRPSGYESDYINITFLAITKEIYSTPLDTPL